MEGESPNVQHIKMEPIIWENVTLPTQYPSTEIVLSGCVQNPSPTAVKVQKNDAETQLVTCKACNKTNIKQIRSHLSKMPQCQYAYDMDALDKESKAKHRERERLYYHHRKSAVNISPNACEDANGERPSTEVEKNKTERIIWEDVTLPYPSSAIPISQSVDGNQTVTVVEKNYVEEQLVTCKACNKTNIKRIRSHLFKMPQCRSAYDIDALDKEAKAKHRERDRIYHQNQKSALNISSNATEDAKRESQSTKVEQNKTERIIWEDVTLPYHSSKTTISECVDSNHTATVVEKNEAGMQFLPCKACNKTNIKQIRSHLSKMPQCQYAYDMDALDKESKAKHRERERLYYHNRKSAVNIFPNATEDAKREVESTQVEQNTSEQIIWEGVILPYDSTATSISECVENIPSPATTVVEKNDQEKQFFTCKACNKTNIKRIRSHLFKMPQCRYAYDMDALDKESKAKLRERKRLYHHNRKAAVNMSPQGSEDAKGESERTKVEQNKIERTAWEGVILPYHTTEATTSGCIGTNPSPKAIRKNDAEAQLVTCKACNKTNIKRIRSHLFKMPQCRYAYDMNAVEAGAKAKRWEKDRLNCQSQKSALNISSIASKDAEGESECTKVELNETEQIIWEGVILPYQATETTISECVENNPSPTPIIVRKNDGETQLVTCRACNKTNIKQIRSHLHKMPQCQYAYDMDAFEAEAKAKRREKGRLYYYNQKSAVNISPNASEDAKRESNGTKAEQIKTERILWEVGTLPYHSTKTTIIECVEDSSPTTTSVQEKVPGKQLLTCKACKRPNIKRLRSHLFNMPQCRYAYDMDALEEEYKAKRRKRDRLHHKLKSAARSTSCASEDAKGESISTRVDHVKTEQVIGEDVTVPYHSTETTISESVENNPSPTTIKDEKNSDPEKQLVTCKACNRTNIKRIRSHLYKMPQCQYAYDMDALEEESKAKRRRATCRRCRMTRITCIRTHILRNPKCRSAYDMNKIDQWYQERTLKRTKNRRVRSTKKTSLSQKTPCEICGREFRFLETLKKHMMKHMKSFECDMCRACYSSKTNLGAHKRAVHFGKGFVCRECGKHFSQKYNLQLHMTVHTGEKPHKCTTCGNRFTVRSSLLKHMRIHTGEKPFVCGHCGKSFGNRYNKQKHEMRHISRRPYCCTHCESSFVCPSDLRRHVEQRHETSLSFETEAVEEYQMKDECKDIVLTSEDL